MRVRVQRTSVALLCSALLVVVGSGWAVDAQQPTTAAAKKPLSYDTYDYWQSIQGTTLSRDGQWLAYALTSQGADGELVVRNLRTGRNSSIRAARARVHADGKFVVFTIAQTQGGRGTRASGAANAGREPGAAGRGGGRRGGRRRARNQPRTRPGS